MIVVEFLKQSSPFNKGEIAGISESDFADLKKKGVVRVHSDKSKKAAESEPEAKANSEPEAETEAEPEVEPVAAEPKAEEPAASEPVAKKPRRRGRRRQTPPVTE